MPICVKILAIDLFRFHTEILIDLMFQIYCSLYNFSVGFSMVVRNINNHNLKHIALISVRINLSNKKYTYMQGHAVMGERTLVELQC